MPSLLGLDPARYTPHAVHRDDRAYAESNCYCDILVELLHARGDEPLAALGSFPRMDFEGDQWTFFKPPEADLERLFGVDVHEMQPYRDLPVQAAEQLAEGRTIIVELDSWHLPDTAGTSYRAEHVKSSVAIESIDLEAERLRYFHGRGLFELEGPDYRAVFGLDGSLDGALPPYTELVRFDAGERLSGDALRDAARELLRRHLARRPATNPFDRFGARLAEDLPHLLTGDAARYHAYAFATVRMAGSAFEIGGSHVEWLFPDAHSQATAALTGIVDGCKALSFKLARRRAFDPVPTLTALAGHWDEAMVRLDELVG